MTEAPEDFARYSRQMLVPNIGIAGQQRLQRSRALVLGVGALGTALASGLVRAGVGHVRLVDRDFIELHNLQRQTLFDEEDITANLPKAIAAAQKLTKINSSVTVEPVVADVTHRNIESLMKDCDVVLDGSDNFEVRMLLAEACAKHAVPWIYGAVISTYGVTMPILPSDGPCFHALLPNLPAPGSMPTCETAGVLGTVPQVVAALQVTEALKLLTGNHKHLCRELRYLDVWSGEFISVTVPETTEPCPICHGGHYEYLNGEHATRATALCGRSAVQVHPQHAGDIDFKTLADRLTPLGEVVHNAYLLRFTAPPHEMVLFRNGRAIIHGTGDEGAARAFYSRYVGQ